MSSPACVMAVLIVSSRAGHSTQPPLPWSARFPQTANAKREPRAESNALFENEETQRALPLVAPTCINTPRAERKLSARAARPFRTARGEKAATENPVRQLSGSASRQGNKLPTEAEKALI
ncbi:hypothetical protein NDU88_001566 [Pleurodeles waltl]|uniref:Secreted protein n=1 Tax=Pleurodeles waltl TaxID=8319 RepID=A0AAV7Q441_PLEWA|nr:hypothetical protein NDU88_001566 [Pleurodeles waltl]